jgi:hypothetical protein
VTGVRGTERQTAEQQRHHAEGHDLPKQDSTSKFNAQILRGD